MSAKDTSIVRDLVRMLDNVLEYFVTMPDTIERAKFSTQEKEVLPLLRGSTACYKSMLLNKSELAKNQRSSI